MPVRRPAIAGFLLQGVKNLLTGGRALRYVICVIHTNLCAVEYDEFRRQLGKAGLTTKQLAVLLRLNPNSITNYADRGDVPSHLAVIVTLMGEMAEHRIDFQAPLERLDIRPHRPRGAGRGSFGARRQLQLLRDEEG
jgi:hypothetical protein